MPALRTTRRGRWPRYKSDADTNSNPKPSSAVGRVGSGGVTLRPHGIQWREAMRRVVVTGVGVVAPNGIGKEAFWSACVNGKSGVGPIRSFDASALPVHVAGEVPDFDINAFIPSAHRKSLKIMGRAARFGVAAAGLAVRDSGLDLIAREPGARRRRHGRRPGADRSAGGRPALAAACNGDGRLRSAIAWARRARTRCFRCGF